MDFGLGLAGLIEMAVVSSDTSSRHSTLDGNVWDNHDDCYSTDTSLSSLPDDILQAVTQTGEDCHMPWITPSKPATVDLLDNSEPWNFGAIVDAISSPIEPQEDWILSSPNVPMELIDQEL
ncbi:hypothetical protein DL98DRAFT_598639 [Cadophora sp. DSE1049]|nr:hypothetical protein DL98DRAFT_598639 [Cadophora sp. DSE1049]